MSDLYCLKIDSVYLFEKKNVIWLKRVVQKRSKPEINHIRQKNPEAQETLRDEKGEYSLFVFCY